MAKKRCHEFRIKLTFDRPCTPAVAFREAKDTIYGEQYCTVLNEGEPDGFKVRVAKPRKVSK